jgi:RNA polymerase sigma factor (TIGR02999 family)
MGVPNDAGRITALLARWKRGEVAARDELMALVYGELRRMAAARLRGAGPGASLQPTALVHEVYLRLAGSDAAQWNDRAHFFAVASRAMRQIVVDAARRRESLKRGGGEVLVTLDDAIAADAGGARRDVELVALDRALERLAGADESQARLVELRFFGGLTLEEIAAVSSLSLATVKRRWRLARAWLFRELTEGER